MTTTSSTTIFRFPLWICCISRRGLTPEPVVTYHSDIVKQKRLMKLYQPLQERFLASVDCIVASSPNYVASSQTLKNIRIKRW